MNHAPSRRRTGLPLFVLLVATAATAAQGCRSTPKTQAPPDPTPVVGLWSGREGRSYGGYREWSLEIKPENLMRGDRKTIPGSGRYVERGVVCQVQFIADFYPGPVPRINFVIAGRSTNCDAQRFTLHGAVPLADMLVGQLSTETEDQYSNITFRRGAAAPAESAPPRSASPPAP